MNNSYFDILDIINSIRFYLMLSIVCRNNGYFVGDPDEQLDSYLKFIREELHYTEERVRSYIQKASDTMPASFLKYYGMTAVNTR